MSSRNLALVFYIIGVGFGLLNLSAIVLVSAYFEEKRAFAQGIAQGPLFNIKISA